MTGLSDPRAIEVPVLDGRGSADWDHLIGLHPDCSFFHCSAWAQVICKTYGHRPNYLHLHADGEPVALVPLIEVLSPLTGRRGVCLPFSDLCAPLVFRENRLSLIKEELSKLAHERGWKYFEIRGGQALEPSAEAASAFYGHQLHLGGDADAVFQRFTNASKGAIRQAVKNQLEVEVLATSDAMKQFYNLHVRTRKRHGVPPQPISFFMNIQENVIKAGLGFAVLARIGLRAVAAAVFFRFGKQAVYKFAASDPEFRKSRGNNLVMWEAIKYLVKHGAEVLHFGRTPLDNDGLRRFKLSWGAEEEMIRYHRFDVRHGKWMTSHRRESGLHNRIFRTLPLAVNRMAGAVLYPHLD